MLRLKRKRRKMRQRLK
ncbi:hypothetical protein MTR67_051437 [Solanum verrucosum]|uniref:Uncharacterized protein n=1 Tax=Solanum verrucosum TaxID=315347 RepID=A0AAF0ZZ44_SOLVR|nr:hypothetical protein MTR67_051437 [Solanum verrucosum]